MDNLNPADIAVYLTLAYLAGVLVTDVALTIVLSRTAFDLPDQQHSEKRRRSLILWCALLWPATLLVVVSSAIPPVRRWLLSHVNGRA